MFHIYSDAIDGMICAGTSKEAIGQAFNIGSETKTTIEEVINICRSYINEDIDVNGIDTKN